KVDIRIPLVAPYITGLVVKAGTDEPVADVPVEVHQLDREEEGAGSWMAPKTINKFEFPRLPGRWSESKTGKDGRFTLPLLRTDPRSGWPLLHPMAILTAGTERTGYSADLRLDLSVDESTILTDVQLELLPHGAIEGQVKGKNGEPVIGAIVVAYDGRR